MGRKHGTRRRRWDREGRDVKISLLSESGRLSGVGGGVQRQKVSVDDPQFLGIASGQRLRIKNALLWGRIHAQTRRSLVSGTLILFIKTGPGYLRERGVFWTHPRY